MTLTRISLALLVAIFASSCSHVPPDRPGLEKREIEAVIQKGMPALHACHDASPNGATRKSSARVTVEFTIDGKGAVSEAKVKKASARDEVLESCLLREVRTLVFPAPVGVVAVVVDYPFQFQADTSNPKPLKKGKKN